jgi:hypothetical protein
MLTPKMPWNELIKNSSTISIFKSVNQSWKALMDMTLAEMDIFFGKKRSVFPIIELEISYLNTNFGK